MWRHRPAYRPTRSRPGSSVVAGHSPPYLVGIFPGSTRMPDPLFQSLFNETETMTWAPADVVRDRARRRVRRTQVMTVAAAVVAVGLMPGRVREAPRDQAAGQQAVTPRQPAHP